MNLNWRPVEVQRVRGRARPTKDKHEGNERKERAGGERCALGKGRREIKCQVGYSGGVK